MGSKSKTLSDLYLHQLRDLHYAEKHGAKMLGKLAKAASGDEVKALLDTLARDGHGAVERLDTIFEQIDKKSHSVPCEAMQGLIEEAKELLHDFADSDALDEGTVAAARAMIGYGASRCIALTAWARRLGRDEAQVLEGLLAGKRGALDDLDRLATHPPAPPSGADGEPLTLKTAALAGLG